MRGRNVRRVVVFVSVSMLAVGLAACASTPPVTEAEPVLADEPDEADREDADAEPEPEPEPEAEPEPEPDEAALAYFQAFATSRSSSMAEMLDLSDEGSPAHVYAQVQIAYAAALEQQGFPSDAQVTEVIDTGVRLCDPAGGPDACNPFEELTVSSGKLVSFTVDGVGVDDRLAAGGASANQNGVTADLLGAYHSVQSDVLIVAIDLANGGDDQTVLNGYSAEYLSEDGRQVTASDAIGPDDLRPGASTYMVLVFPSQGVGGTVFLGGYPSDFSADLEWEFALTPVG